MCLLYSCIFVKCPPKAQYLIALLSAFIAIALMSDSKYLGLPSTSVIILIAMAINGGFNTLLIIPNTAEAVNLMTARYNIVDGVDDDLVARMNDTLASLYQVHCNLGSLMGKILGALIYQIVGFELTMLIFSAFILLMLIIQLVFNAGTNMSKNHREQQEQIIHLT